jgi:hypothetical protein
MNDTPIRSGVPLIDACFDLCVDILMWLADLFGVSYNTINIWIFCILWPLLTLGLILVVLRQHRVIQKLRRDQPKQKP